MKIKNFKDRAEIYIHGVIIDDTDANWLRPDIGYEWPANIKEQLEELNGIPIDVHIASDGGDVSAGVALFNMLRGHNAPVTVYIDSWGASIASFIAFAGQKIVMPANTFLMIHNPSGGAFGNSDYIRSVADWLDKIRDMLANTYAEAGNKSVDEIKTLMDAETWLTANEAKEIWPDKIDVVESNDIEAVACRSSFASAPDILKKVVTEKTLPTAENSPSQRPEANIITQENASSGETIVENAVNDIKNAVDTDDIVKLLMEAYKL